MKKLIINILLNIFFLFSFLHNQTYFHFEVEDFQGRIKNLSSSQENFIIICYSYYNCIECFKIIKFLIRKYSRYKIYFLARVTKNTLYFKQKAKYDIENSLRKYYNGKFEIYFDIHNNEDPWPPINLKEGIFGKYQISKTPAYFIISKDAIILKHLNI